MPLVKTPYKVTRNEVEEEAFPKFLARIEALGDIYGDSVVEEVTLMRFLRARALDADRAEQMLLDMLKWREENKVNGYLETYKPLKKEILQFSGGIHKTDIEGDPVMVNRLGQYDAKGIMAAFGEDEMLKLEIFKQERMEKFYRDETARRNRLVERVTVIMDLNGLCLKHMYTPALQCLRKIAALGEANYPERLKRCFIVNGPSIFPRIWNMVKGFFDPRTQKKIFILGANFKEELVKFIPEENIPEYLGGKSNIDGDIYCKADIPCAGPVPLHLYGNLSGDDDEGEKKVVVKAGAFHQHSLDVLEGQLLKWSYKTEGKDIGFQLSLLTIEEQEVMIKEYERVAGGSVVFEGEHLASLPGKYIFKWDNSFSWMSSKSLTYTIERKEMASPSASTNLLPSSSAPTPLS